MAGDVNLEALQGMQVGRVEFGPAMRYPASLPANTFGEMQALPVAEYEALRKDAERYRKLVASGSFSPSRIGTGWGMTLRGEATKAELDAAVDGMPESVTHNAEFTGGRRPSGGTQGYAAPDNT